MASVQFGMTWREVLVRFNRSALDAVCEYLQAHYDVRANLEMRRFCDMDTKGSELAGPVVQATLDESELAPGAEPTAPAE